MFMVQAALVLLDHVRNSILVQALFTEADDRSEKVTSRVGCCFISPLMESDLSRYHLVGQNLGIEHRKMITCGRGSGGWIPEISDLNEMPH